VPQSKYLNWVANSLSSGARALGRSGARAQYDVHALRLQATGLPHNQMPRSSKMARQQREVFAKVDPVP
jgi:hypothetical protein